MWQFGNPNVIAYSPQGLASRVPLEPEITNDPLATVWFHGRRSPTGGGAGCRYSEDELEPLVEGIRAVTKHVAQTVAMMNNCYGNYGATNVQHLLTLFR